MHLLCCLSFRYINCPTFPSSNVIFNQIRFLAALLSQLVNRSAEFQTDDDNDDGNDDVDDDDDYGDGDDDDDGE